MHGDGGGVGGGGGDGGGEYLGFSLGVESECAAAWHTALQLLDLTHRVNVAREHGWELESW